MEVLILTVFCSLVLVAAGVGFFVWTVREQTFDHTDRLSLLPLEDDLPVEQEEPHAEDPNHVRR